MTVEEAWAQIEALVEQVKAEGREFTDEEAQRFEELEQAHQRALKNREAKERAENLTKVRGTAPKAKVAVVNEPEPKERAFDSFLRNGIADSNYLEKERAQSVGTNSAGGYLVPETMRQKLIERLKAFGGVANEVEVINTSSGERMTWPSLDDTANTGVITAENTAPASGGADLVFTEVTLDVYKYTAPGTGQLPLRVSVELLQDSAFDVQGLVNRNLGTRIARAQANHWVNGTGSSQPLGLTAKTGGPSYTATGAAITYADLVAAKHSVDPEYRTNAVWAFNDATLADLEGLVDGNGRPLLNSSVDSISGDVKLTLLGHRVVVDQAFADYADGGTNVWGVFGDLREGYVIRRVQDVTMIVDPYTRANEGQVQYTMWVRAGGTVQNPYAYATLKNAV